ncbi:MAG TPA: tRNA (N6-isopentenyl adenosine(37)-C2)-methylthiotransferase MiaB [Bacteroidales bacterium]|nr:tRNA (N6-isopentenyl adenosine(37)-C2)-methylthiotransferase MiaB [Bacteroidales bacterium]
MKNKKFFIETYGCQMNFSDSEIVASILEEGGFGSTKDIRDADMIFINTCSIRDNAEQRVRKRLGYMQSLKKKNPRLVIGMLGCMAERLKTQLLEEEQVLDLIAGPDSYRDLPRLMAEVESGRKAVNTLLSIEETYADISPVRYDSNGISAFISIMRGCENYCAYCVVPYVRGQERSRDAASITQEAEALFHKGFREVTLLGQNVNSYQWTQDEKKTAFAGLLEKVAWVNPLLRIRFATSHPKDLSDELLLTMARWKNICKAIHLPVQSGSTRILDHMNRGYTREQYLERIAAIRNFLPDCAISTDIIAGFCDEKEEDHKETLSLMEQVGFDYAYMFRYSERPDTLAADRYQDNVPAEVKDRRLREIIDLQQKLSYQSNKKDVGKTFEVLIEGFSKRSDEFFSGRNSQNKMVVFPVTSNKPGEYVRVKINRFTSATLIGETI